MSLIELLDLTHSKSMDLSVLLGEKLLTGLMFNISQTKTLDLKKNTKNMYSIHGFLRGGRRNL